MNQNLFDFGEVGASSSKDTASEAERDGDAEVAARKPQPIFSVSDALAVINQTLEYAMPTLTVVGEVASFKINQGKWVFFDIKDDDASLNCFMSVYNLRVAVEDGMQVAVTARPGLTKWGKFSLTVQAIRPIGEGNLRRAYELLKAKLSAEGLFLEERKRPLPFLPARVGVISSVAAAGYSDFIKILDERFGGISVEVANVQVQGVSAPEQMIRALSYFNELAHPPEVIAILRGGGSADDLAAFNDELLVRAIAASRAPTIVGVGHEVDVTLADLAADVRAATPSNAAQILVPDRRELGAGVAAQTRQLLTSFANRLDVAKRDVAVQKDALMRVATEAIRSNERRLEQLQMVLRQLDPGKMFTRGYSIVRNARGEIVRGSVDRGAVLEIENAECIIKTKAESLTKKKRTLA